MSQKESQHKIGISVIIPAYNSHLTLGASIEGLKGQTAFERIESLSILPIIRSL